MKNYRTYLFDLDDTLLNFRETEKLSFKMTIDHMKITHDVNELFTYYKSENEKLWSAFEQGLVSKDDLKVRRFILLSEHFGLNIDAKKMSDYYVDTFPNAVVLLDGALDVLEAAKQRGQVGIITNGIEYIQHKRIEISGIKQFVDFVCVSEKCGYPKPDERFFQYTANHAKDFSKEHTIIIGDRYEADIFGGHNFGIDTCWYNHEGVSVERPIHTYEIRTLRELHKMILKGS